MPYLAEGEELTKSYSEVSEDTIDLVELINQPTKS